MIYQIRPIQKTDLESIYSMELSSYEEPWSATSIAGELDTPGAFHRCIVDEKNIPIGYYFARFQVDEAHLLKITVSPERRRQGLGRALLEMFEGDAEKIGAAILLLEVRVSNSPAIFLYEQFGYQTIQLRKNYYQNGETARVMLKWISPDLIPTSSTIQC